MIRYCEEHYPTVATRLRPSELSALTVREEEIILDAIGTLEDEGYASDIVVSLGVHNPLRTPSEVQKAVDTLLLYDVDLVLSVHENHHLYYVHGERGLEPLNPAMHRRVRVEREGLFEGNGAVRVYWRDTLDEPEAYCPKVGHIVVPPSDGFQIKSPHDAWLAEQLLYARKGGRSLRPESWQN